MRRSDGCRDRYLEATTQQYTFSERGGVVSYGEIPLFDVAPAEGQPQIDLHRVRFDPSAADAQSMVKCLPRSSRTRAPSRGRHDDATMRCDL